MLLTDLYFTSPKINMAMILKQFHLELTTEPEFAVGQPNLMRLQASVIGDKPLMSYMPHDTNIVSPFDRILNAEEPFDDITEKVFRNVPPSVNSGPLILLIDGFVDVPLSPSDTVVLGKFIEIYRMLSRIHEAPASLRKAVRDEGATLLKNASGEVLALPGAPTYTEIADILRMTEWLSRGLVREDDGRITLMIPALQWTITPCDLHVTGIGEFPENRAVVTPSDITSFSYSYPAGRYVVDEFLDDNDLDA